MVADDQYRTRPVLELMNVIDTTHRQFPEEERDRPRKRKSDEVADDEHEVDNEVDDEDIVNVKPGQDELLTARLHDLQVRRSPRIILLLILSSVRSRKSRNV